MAMFIARNTTWHNPIILMLLLRHKEASLVWWGGAISAAAADFLISRHSVLCYFILFCSGFCELLLLALFWKEKSYSEFEFKARKPQHSH